MAEPLADLLARLERERLDADRRYNDALTALDRSAPGPIDVPPPLPPVDDSQLPVINQSWDILPNGAPAIDGSIKGRLRGLVWRLVGPSLEAQRHFNAAVVHHLNQAATAQQDAHAAIGALLGAARTQADALRLLHAHLIQYLQTITLFVDTKDRRVAGDLQVLNDALSAIADDWLKRWESGAAPIARLEASVAAMEEIRAVATLAQQAAIAVRREVERLAPAPAASAPSPAAAADMESFTYVGFEDAFRGSQTEIRGRLADYVGRFEGLRDVLDIGCGRGEFLDLLREHGIPARGIDTNHAMVEESRARGLDVRQADAIGYLQSLPDGALGGIFSAQVIEHLQPDYLTRLLSHAAVKIRPGGLIVLETINPTCWTAFFESYIRDLTHVRPIHPETLQFLLRASGFSPVEIEYRSPVDPAARLQPLLRPADPVDPATEVLVETFNANVAALNARLFGFQDYAAIGRRPE